MTDTDPIEDQATAALDAILPRRAPRYEAAHAYLTTFLATDPATRRLAMRALKAASPDTEHDQAASLPAAGVAPESGEDHDGAAAPRAEEVRDGNPEGRAVAGSTTAAGTQSGQPRLACGGTACRIRSDGKEIHIPDPSCSKLSGRRGRG